MRAISVDFRPPSAIRTTAVAMGLLAAAGITAPAALAAGDESPADEAATTVPEADAVRGEVLTPAPAVAEATAPDPVGAHFGWGKLDPDVVVAQGSSFPSGAELDRTGAQIRVTFQRFLGSDTADSVDFPEGPPFLECTWDETDADDNGNLCDFSEEDGPVEGGRVVLLPDSAFTVELLTAPSSGQVLLPSGADRVISGYTDGASEGPVEAVFEAPGAYRTIGVTLTDARGAAVAGATFELCTQPGGTCAPGPVTASGVAAASPLPVAGASTPVVSSVSSPTGLLVFPGLYLPGDYQIRQTASADGRPFSTAPIMLRLLAAGSVADTSAPVLLPVALGGPAPAPVTAAPAAAPASAPAPAPAAAAAGSTGRLASTGAEPVPVLALGAGLVLAGGAVTLAATRRRTR